jgi:hypothetical protein
MHTARRITCPKCCARKSCRNDAVRFLGMPFLADPQLGAWYPLNWPFFLAGITPRAIEWQLALHCLLAAMGGYLLGRDLLRSRAAAVFAGIFFAFSGVFAAHSSHPGIFQAASLAPWLLWTGRRAASASRWLPALGLVAAAMILTGHFQTALYAFFALAIFLAVDAGLRGGSLRGSALAVLVAVAIAVGAGAALSAVMVLPGLELTADSVRANADYSRMPAPRSRLAHWRLWSFPTITAPSAWNIIRVRRTSRSSTSTWGSYWFPWRWSV